MASTVTDAGGLHFGGGQTLQAVEFPDGSTAIIQRKGDLTTRLHPFNILKELINCCVSAELPKYLHDAQYKF